MSAPGDWRFRHPGALPSDGMLVEPLRSQPLSQDSGVTPAPSDWTPGSSDVTPLRSGEPGAAPLLAPGTKLSGRYRISRFIAAGGMGEVYQAEDLALGTDVALKAIRPEVAARDSVMKRFRRETLLARRVTHPNVCRIFDLGHHSSSESGPEVTFLTMELLGGETLR